MDDAVRPDEFRQRFTAARRCGSTNVAAVLEVLTIAGRPAALLEWVRGLPSRRLAGPGGGAGVVVPARVPGGGGAARGPPAGLCHGHLDASSFVLTATAR